jgi:hypothetical protein
MESELLINDTTTIDITDSTSDELYIILKLSKEGQNEFLEMLQERVGFIDDEVSEQIINDVNVWMNKKYGYLLEFYIKAIDDGLVPKNKFNALVDDNKKCRILIDKYVNHLRLIKNVKSMEIDQLSELAKKFNIPFNKQTSKKKLLDSIMDSLLENL